MTQNYNNLQLTYQEIEFMHFVLNHLSNDVVCFYIRDNDLTNKQFNQFKSQLLLKFNDEINK